MENGNGTVALFFLPNFFFYGKEKNASVGKASTKLCCAQPEKQEKKRERERDSASTNVTHVFFFL